MASPHPAVSDLSGRAAVSEMEGMEPSEGQELHSDLELSSDDGETSSTMAAAQPEREPEPEPEQAVPGMYDSHQSFVRHPQVRCM